MASLGVVRLDIYACRGISDRLVIRMSCLCFGGRGGLVEFR